MTSISSSTLLLLPKFEYKSIELPINYENILHINLPVFDCDTIDQIKQKLIHYLNSYEKTSHDQIDLLLPSLNNCLCSHQIPIIKQYSINSTILCRKKSQWKNYTEKNFYMHHLCIENQLINDENLIKEKLKENKNRLREVLKNFYGEILQGLKGFNKKFYIEVISDLIRKLNMLMICRSTCPIIQSCLNVIADGLEFCFQTKNQVKFKDFIRFQIEFIIFFNSFLRKLNFYLKMIENLLLHLI
jgi:hypothetical protein